MKIQHLKLSWSISRGRDTAGYNICRLDSGYNYNHSARRYKTTGGGYDMIGTVFGMWLTEQHQDKLQGLFKGVPVAPAPLERRDNPAQRTAHPCGYSVPGYLKLSDLYGITLNPKGEAHCDGGCGINSMVSIAEAIGLTVQTTSNRKGHTDGFIVSWEGV